MAVYIDDMYAPFGRMKMCHMFADTKEELLAMADRIGVKRKWIQKEGTEYEHFDVSKGMRELALSYGAIPLVYPSKEIADIFERKRNARSRTEPVQNL